MSKTEVNPEPEFDRDQLLSDHLDGRLDPSQADTLRAMLRDDPAMSHQLDQMRADGETLRTLFRETSANLGSDFATRVVAAASDRAVQQGLAESHPLRRLIVAVEPPRRSSVLLRRPIASLVSIAAGLLVVIGAGLAWQKASSVGPEIQSIASLPERNVLVPGAESVRSPEPLSVRSPEPLSVRSPEPLLADSVVPDVTEPKVSVPIVAVPKTSAPVSPMVSMPGNAALPDMMQGAILVYDVQLTQRGRLQRSVRQAMNAIGLDATSEQPINEDVVGIAQKSSVSQDAERYQILYLRASAKQLDRLFNRLLEDHDGVDSVGMTLVTDAPILKIAATLRDIDPTDVRHGTASYELRGNDPGRLADTLSRRDFMPMTAMRSGEDAKADGASTGVDEISQVIVLIR